MLPDLNKMMMMMMMVCDMEKGVSLDILRESLGHNFVSGLRTLKPE